MTDTPELLVTDKRAAVWEKWVYAHREFLANNKRWLLIRDLLADRRTLKQLLAEAQSIEGAVESDEEAW